MPSVFSSERRVEFCETDAAGIAHFSSLLIYMEQAEHALLRSLGLSVVSSNAGKDPQVAPRCSWPRVKVECDFISPAKFEEVISLQTTVASLGTKSVTYQHRLSIGSNLVATGKITCVCCTQQAGSMASIKIPQHIRELLTAYLVAH